ncbi:MAG: TetR/AcrR family transcriptional regulator [Thermodesulfobacteriota bacterium]|nr:TetR/AcrR family transcriptional regulator [Thermodesulfobacteriota bacterium]
MARETFKRIPLSKQRMILDVAAKEFAINGFHKANVNTIASKAGISIGAMYKYFANKNDLFSETLLSGITMLNEYYLDISSIDADPFEKIRMVFEKVGTLISDTNYFPHLYLALISSGMDDFASTYADSIEQVGHDFFTRIIRDGMDQGYIERGKDMNLAIFFLDNHLMMYLFSQISTFLQIRCKTFLGEKAEDKGYIVDETVQVCRRIFALPANK